MAFLTELKYQCNAMREDGRIFWKRRGDGSFLQPLLYILTCHGWHIMILHRIGKIIYAIPIPVISHILKIVFRLVHFVFSTLYGIEINPISEIGPGFYIGHYGCIFVRGEIGKNCSVSQGVTLGAKGAGKSNGWPTLGDNVYIGAGAKILGVIHVGDNVVVGANAVVTKSVPANSLAVGAPAIFKTRQ
jgi:serine O-acetyltransferase